MRYLGIDYGTKKIGTALSDEDGVLAFPHRVIAVTAGAHETLGALARENGAAHVVIGHSQNLQGEDNPLMRHVRNCQSSLERQGLSVSLEPEFLTTQQAKRHTGDAMADASAAALILQSFLDSKTESNTEVSL